VDPDATVEWSSADLAALGLEPGEGTHVGPPVHEEGSHDDVSHDEYGHDEADWDDEDWDDDHEAPVHQERLQPIERRSAPRWQVVVLGILLVALLAVLALTFLGGDDEGPTPTTPSTEGALPAAPGTTTAWDGTATIVVVRG